MKLNGRDKMAKFGQERSDAKGALKSWAAVIEETAWKNPAEMKQTYRTADLVGSCTVFNIRGGNYRLIARISYKTQIVEVLHVLTHTEYDRDRWKDDCDC